MDSKDKRTGWLRGLEVGSQVFVENYGNKYLESVTNITPTGRMTVGSSNYNEFGREMGKGYRGCGRWKLAECTEEALREFRTKQSISTLKRRISDIIDRRNHIDWEEKDLIDVWNVLKKYHKKEEQ